MKKINKIRIFSAMGVLPLLAMFVYPSISSADVGGTVQLCTPSPFAVLAGTTITNTGPTVINGTAGGDIGLFSGSSFTGDTEITKSGVTHNGDDQAKKAKDDLIAAFNNSGASTPVVLTKSDLDSQILTPGTYSTGDGTFKNSGKLVLDAKGDPNAKFIFQAGSTLMTSPGSTITLINGAQACNVFWKVGSSATLGAHSTFVGELMAMDSITANPGASIEGQLLARNGGVVLNSNTINNASSTTPVPTVTPTPLMATLHVIDVVVNNSGGTAVAGDFVIHVKQNGVDVPGSPAVGLGAAGRTYTLPAGNYTVTEEPRAGYIGAFTGPGITTGFVALTPGADVTITRTNTDLASAVVTPTPTPAPVVVTPPTSTGSPTTSKGGTSKGGTVNGGKLPKTGSPWYNLLALGGGLILLGGVGFTSRKVLK
jgi:LPXTG-motif cell wall-anchored protein